MAENTNKKVKFSDYLYILYKWRKFLIINILIVIIASTLYAFMLPKHFKSTVVFMMPQETTLGLGGLTDLLGGKGGSAALGARLLGARGGAEDILLGILNSRTAITHVIEKFNLTDYYEINDNLDKVIRSFARDLNFEFNEYGMIEIDVINKNPVMAADIANYYVRMLDSVNIKINSEQARNNRKFIEKRYFQNLVDIRIAEDSMYIFQKKYGIVSVPEQLEVAVKAAAEIEAQLVARELTSKLLKEQFGENSPQFNAVETEITMLRNRVTELKDAEKLTSLTNVLFPFRKMPDISMEYLQRYRELEKEQTIMNFILPLYEQAKVEEQKSIPTVMVLDKAVPAQLKHSPKRAFIILFFTFIFFFSLIVIIYRGEHSIRKDSYLNPLEEKEKKFYFKIARFYGIKD